MKKNNLIILIAIGLYSGLFYEQLPGINFLIFTVLALIMSQLYWKNAIKNTNWLLAAAGAFISAVCIAWHGNWLSFIANVISLSLVSAFALNKNTSVAAGLLMSATSIITSWYVGFLDFMLPGNEQRPEPVPGEKSKALARLFIIGIPTVIVLVFFFLYRASNAVFDHYAAMINFDFISFEWVFFTLGGVVLMFAFFRFREIKRFGAYDVRASGALRADRLTGGKIEKILSIENENTAGLVLFGLLNIMLLALNALDINFLFLGAPLPKGINHSQMVHQGVDALIWSIILAISIILFLFRGRLNFFAENRILKMLAYLWILQNIFMVFSTGCRNYLYISADGITAKRIGVYFYLGLCIVGLIYTLLKIWNRKTNWNLVRQVSMAYYILLILSCFMNWEVFITDYNYDFQVRHQKKVDGGYFIAMDARHLDDLIAMRTLALNKNSTDSSFHNIDEAIYRYLYTRGDTDWRSWNYDDAQISMKLDDWNANGKINSISLDGAQYRGKIETLARLHLQKIQINNGRLERSPRFKGFETLKELNLKNMHLHSIDGIEALQNLVYLDLSGNEITDVSPLYHLTQLKKLNPGIVTQDCIDNLKLKLPHTEIVYVNAQAPIENTAPTN
jgi:hypothetical protein